MTGEAVGETSAASGVAADAAAGLAELRELVPRVVGAVVRGCGDFAAAEDAVQEALLAATSDWPQRGRPQNPGGWLYHVACRRLADQQDAERSRRRREAASAIPADATAPEPSLHAEDDTLLLLFLCCHPALKPEAAVALTLRAVGGLTTSEIARAFFVPDATMAQRISRAKQAIRTAGATFTMPDAADREARLQLVMHVLYLIFNEGYLSHAGPALLRVELSREAIRLARILHREEPEHPEAEGLLALMLLTDARRAARTGSRGELIPLHEQDRGLWNRAAIEEGTTLVQRALGRGRVGSYQVQAAIAALHDESANAQATDWGQILALYELLARMSDNPMAALSRAIALAMVRGTEAGLDALAAIEADDRLAGQRHRVEAARAHLHEFAGNHDAAAKHFRAAAAGTSNEAERRYLMKKAERLAVPPRG